MLDEPATQGPSKQWSQVMEETAHNKPQPSLQDWRDLDPGSSGPTIPTAGGIPQESPSSSGGEGWGWPDNGFDELRLARLMARLRGGCARVRAIHPSSSSRVSRLEEPGHESWAGEVGRLLVVRAFASA